MSIELRRQEQERRLERELLDKKQEEFAIDLRAVAQTSEGKRLLAWMVGQGNIFRDDYAPGDAGAYAAGKKAAALALARLLREALARDAFLAVVVPEDEHHA